MSAYKDSGIKWLGKIPAHWEVVKLGKICSVLSGGTPSRANKDYWENGTIKWLGSTACKDTKIVEADYEYITEEGLQNSSTKIFQKGTILLAIAGNVGKVSYLNFDAAINQNIAGIVPYDESVLLSDYLFYCFLNSKFYFNGLAKNEYRMVNLSFVRDLPVLFPPLEEQRKIADFLDKKLEKIDYFIAKQTKFIELLKEQKQVLINQATTKGLNKSTELKDTHISHLGKIPTHWEVVKMSFLGSFGKGGKLSRADLTEDGEFSAVLYGDIYTQYNFKIEHCKSRISKDKAEIKADKGDLFFTASGETREDIGKCVAFISDEETYIGGDIIVFKSIDVDSMYLSYFLNNDYSKLIKAIYSKGEIIIHIHQEALKNILIALPPPEEQRKIAKYLDEKCEKIDKAINNITKQISLIQEYKTSLIDTTTKGMLKELK